MTLTLITAPAAEPVTLAEAKLQRKVEHTVDDAWFTGTAIPAARRLAEHKLGRALIEQTWELTLDSFPADWIDLQKTPVSAIVSVIYLDSEQVEQTLSDALYELAPDQRWLRPVIGESWPSAYSGADTVRVQFTAGYGADGAAVPAEIREWMLMHIATAHKNREFFAAGISVAELPNRFVDGLLDAQRDYS